VAFKGLVSAPIAYRAYRLLDAIPRRLWDHHWRRTRLGAPTPPDARRGRTRRDHWGLPWGPRVRHAHRTGRKDRRKRGLGDRATQPGSAQDEV